jgi:hypothetical protein
MITIIRTGEISPSIYFLPIGSVINPRVSSVALPASEIEKEVTTDLLIESL